MCVCFVCVYLQAERSELRLHAVGVRGDRGAALRGPTGQGPQRPAAGHSSIQIYIYIDNVYVYVYLKCGASSWYK